MKRLFSETEQEHAARIGETLRRTKLLRRALTVKLRGGEYPPEMPRYIRYMEIPDLTAALMVAPQEENKVQVFVPAEEGTAPGLTLEAFARRVMAAHREGRGVKRSVRLARGQHVGHLPFGFVERPDGGIEPDPGLAEPLRDAIYEACELGYSAAAKLLNDEDVRTPRGGAWNGDKVRDWVRNPYLAGYNRVFPERKQWRRWVALYPSQHQPLISLALWIKANGRFCLQARVDFPEGFRDKYDQDSWERREEIVRNAAPVEL